jgi:hypothetical protein
MMKEILEKVSIKKLISIKEKKFEKGMTREELGRHGWTLLHMISATLPVEFDDNFKFKLNVFLNLLYYLFLLFLKKWVILSM